MIISARTELVRNAPVTLRHCTKMAAVATEPMRRFRRSTMKVSFKSSSPDLWPVRIGFSTSCSVRSRERVILGIESSCDDSCASIVSAPHEYASLSDSMKSTLLSSVVLSQDHSRTGGIEPLVAAHGHGANVPRAVRMALDQAGIAPTAGSCAVDAIAVTQGPGMAGCLNVGLTAAKTLSALWGVPIIYCHHMAGEESKTTHERPKLPFLTLLLSGGHTLLVLARSVESFSVLASSDDISIGDAFDKVARHLQLEWSKAPGRDLEAFAAEEDEQGEPHEKDKIEFPVAMRGLDGFSYSGLHTAVQEYLDAQQGEVTSSHRKAVAKAFQRAAFAQVEDKLRMYFGPLPRGRRKSASLRKRIREGGAAVAKDEQYSDTDGRDVEESVAAPLRVGDHSKLVDTMTGSQQLWAERTTLVKDVRHLVVSGGVAANRELRQTLQRRLEKLGRQDVQLLFPPLEFCTDNAAMIAHLGHLLWHRRTMELGETPRARWSLNDIGCGDVAA